MIKSRLGVLLSGLVLLGGLLSCGPDKGKQVKADVYVPRPPQVLRAKGGAVQLAARESAGTNELETADRLDFSLSRPAAARVLTQCGRLRKDTELRVSAPTPVAQLLPEEALARDLGKEPTECTFEISQFNPAGSRHVFSLRAVAIKESAPGVRVGLDSGAEVPLTVGRLGGVRVRYRNEQPASARLICRDARFTPLGFDQVFNLEDVDFRQPEMRGRQNERPLSETRWQSCRIQIEENGTITGMSAPLMLQFPRAPFNVAAADFPETAAQGFALFERFLPVRIHAATLRNPEPYTRALAVPAEHNVTAAFYVREPSGQFVMNVDTGANYMSVEVEGKEVRHADGYLRFSIGPGEVVRLRLLYRHLARHHCRPANGILPAPLTKFAVALNVQNPVSVIELDEAQNAIGEFALFPVTARLLTPVTQGLDLTRFHRVVGKVCQLAP